MLTTRSRRPGTIKGRTVLGKTMVAERIKGFVALAGFAPLCRRRRRSHGIGNAVANFRPGKLLVTRGIRYAKVDIFVNAAVGVISLPLSIVAVLRAH